MKAISPSRPPLPATAPLRSDRSSGASAADEAFGALIAAAIGATPRPVVSHDAPPKRATASGSSVKPSSSGDDNIRQSNNSKADADQPAAPGADQAAATASSAKPQAASDATKAVAEAPAPVALPVVVGAKPAAAPVAAAATPTVAKVAPDAAAGKGVPPVPPGLESAAAALAQALTADAPAKPARPSPLLEAKPIAAPTSAPAQGQLPTQLVKLPTAPAPSAQPAKADDKPPAIASRVTAPPAPSVATPQIAVAAAAQVTPNAASSSATGQHDAHDAKGEGQHSPSTTTVSALATSDSKTPAAPASFDQTLQVSSPVANVVLPAPVQQPVAAAVSQAAQAVAPPPAEQIVQLVAPLRTAKDGDYTLSLQLHPADLGPVTVRVDVHQGVLSVHMVADNAQGHDALNQGLNDLRSQLEAGGVRTGDIGLGSRSSLSQQQGQQQAAHHQSPDSQGGRDDSSDRRPVNTGRERVTASHDDAALDVRI